MWPNTRGGLCGSDLIRGIVFDGNGLIQGVQGQIQDFKLGGGAHLKKLHRAEGGAKFFGVFRVKVGVA